MRKRRGIDMARPGLGGAHAGKQDDQADNDAPEHAMVPSAGGARALSGVGFIRCVVGIKAGGGPLLPGLSRCPVASTTPPLHLFFSLRGGGEVSALGAFSQLA